MWRALTPAERRGLLLVALLYLGGGAWDLWRSGRRAPIPPEPIAAFARPDSTAREVRAAPAPSGAIPPLQLNQASEAQLDALPGIGPVLAHRIVEHRARYGPFHSVGELRAVRGIGTSLMSRLEGRIAADSL